MDLCWGVLSHLTSPKISTSHPFIGSYLKSKVGHINLLAGSRKEARAKLGQLDPAGLASLQKTTTAAAAAGLGRVSGGGPPLVGIIMGSDSDLATMKAAAQVRGTHTQGQRYGLITTLLEAVKEFVLRLLIMQHAFTRV